MAPGGECKRNRAGETQSDKQGWRTTEKEIAGEYSAKKAVAIYLLVCNSKSMKANTTKQLIDAHGMTVEQVAVEAQASVSAVRNWYNGQKPKRIYQRELDRLIDSKRPMEK